MFIFTIILTNLQAQDVVNQYDEEGRRHGMWSKNYYETNQKRYEGLFNHGKEVDTFKYYKLSNGKSVLSAIKVFNAKDSLADITFFASNKKVISKGSMKGKSYIGQWIYFHKNSELPMIIEHFNTEGQLDGEKKTLYKNGQVAELVHYKNGKLNGEALWYTENNQLLKKAEYKDGLLNGLTINYDASGNITSTGPYLEDRKAGIWKYYEAGELKKEIDHTNQIIIKKYK
ncbi:toxin-antitoxin system YwqK family antitoxin [Winogradskyella sp.]|uniref:toxin-antitoxin system YwqK family antitoxin n=1 Tax=Winogradskyella sp. TaxID=1883156 RepID=UPI003704418B